MKIVIDNALLPALPAFSGSSIHPAQVKQAQLAQQQALQSLAAVGLPHLKGLLATMQRVAVLRQDDWAWSTPADVAHAQALGLPSEPGCIPWAAWQTGLRDTPCAWMSPCHWRVGVDRMSLLDPFDLQLSEAESQAFLALIAPWLAQDGLTFLRHHHASNSPHAWLITGDLLRDLPCASLACAVGRSLDPWLPSTGNPQGAVLRRLQNELQMLLYTHPLNEQREAEGRLPVNAVWLHGAGALAAGFEANPLVLREQRLAQLPQLSLPHTFADWVQAWQAIDAQVLAPIAQDRLHSSKRGVKSTATHNNATAPTLELVLCGENQQHLWRSTPASPASWLAAWWPLDRQRRWPQALMAL
jgi:hypothetical protein